MARGKKRRSSSRWRDRPSKPSRPQSTPTRPPQSTELVTGRAPVTRSQSRAAGSATLPTVTPLGSRSTAAQSLRRRRMPTTQEAAAADSSVAQVVATAAEAAAAGDSIGPQVAIVAAEETAAADSSVTQVAAKPAEAAATASSGAQVAIVAAEGTAAADSIGAQMVDPDSTYSAEKTTVGDFVPNSPIHEPCLVDHDSDGKEDSPPVFPNPILYKDYVEAAKIYSEKMDQLKKLPTLDDNISVDPELIEGKAEDAILKAAKFVLGLSSYIDGELLVNCSGILIGWDKGTGTILTIADLLCSSSPNLNEWLGGKEYAANAEVRVQLLHMKGTEVNGKLEYLNKQYNFALISAPMDQPSELAHFSEKVEFGQDVILVGRDKLHLQTCDGKVSRQGAGLYQRHHYMSFESNFTFSFGGPIIDMEGAVIGMVANALWFISSSTIQKCLNLWETFGVVPRIHLGMKFLGIKCLNLPSKDRIYWDYNVNAGLIVREVSGGSNAEKHGVRMGDIVQSVNGKCIATAVELENMMLDICKDHLEKGIGIETDADVMVTLGVVNTTKRVSGEIQLTAKLSHKVEIIARGKRVYEYPTQKKPDEASSRSE